MWLRRGVDGVLGLRRGELVEVLFSGGCGARQGRGMRVGRSEEEEEVEPHSPIYSRGEVTGALARLSRDVGRIGRGPLSMLTWAYLSGAPR